MFVIKTRPSVYTYTQHNISYSSGRRLAPLDAYIFTRTRDAVRSVSIFRSVNDENRSCPISWSQAISNASHCRETSLSSCWTHRYWYWTIGIVIKAQPHDSMFMHFGMAFIVKCSLTIEHVIIAISSSRNAWKYVASWGGGGLAPPWPLINSAHGCHCSVGGCLPSPTSAAARSPPGTYARYCPCHPQTWRVYFLLVPGADQPRWL